MSDVPPSPATSPWKQARVIEIRQETARAKTFRLAVPDVTPHLAGQHYVVRLTAPDGYVAQRSYSVASPPEAEAELDPDGVGHVELTVERLEDGEVSGYLDDAVQVGDELEVRGPLGGWFVWDVDSPAVLIGGGSGVVPLMAMLRAARNAGKADLVRLVVSVRTPGDLLYPSEIVGPETTVIYTRITPPDTARPAGRLTDADLAPVIGAALDEHATVYICGSAGFADAVSRHLVTLGVTVEQVRVERFGPSG